MISAGILMLLSMNDTSFDVLKHWNHVFKHPKRSKITFLSMPSRIVSLLIID